MGRNLLPEEGNVSMTKSKEWAENLNQATVDEDYTDDFSAKGDNP